MTCPWHSAHGKRVIESIATEHLIATEHTTEHLIASCTPGNRPPPWSWEDEAAYVDSQSCCCEDCTCDGGDLGWYQRSIEDRMREAGRWIGPPAMLGSDRVVRDGHHRVISAWRVGIPAVPTVPADWPLRWQGQMWAGARDYAGRQGRVH